MRIALVLAAVAAVGCGAPRRSEDPQIRDQEITRDIMMALHGNERFADVRVDCRKGVAILEGIVTGEADRHEAERLAWGVSGVQDVRSAIRLRSR